MTDRQVQDAQTFLFVPGSRQGMFDKAVKSGADVVIIDLEDAVAPHEKDIARERATTWLAAGGCAAVRVNAVGSPWFRADMAAVVMLAQPPVETNVMGNVFFDTCVYHQPGIDLLLDVVETRNVLFGSEMVGAVRGIDPRTGHHYDDTRRYVDAAVLDDGARAAVYESNVRRVYPRLHETLEHQGR